MLFLLLKEILGYITEKKWGRGHHSYLITKTSEDIFQVILGNIEQITGLFAKRI